MNQVEFNAKIKDNLGAVLKNQHSKNMAVNVNKYQGFESMPINEPIAKQQALPAVNKTLNQTAALACRSVNVGGAGWLAQR